MNQEKALSILKSGKNVFLTGSAGTGKTYVLNNYIKYLKQHKIPVAITASTGIAATHMGGQTIHAWSGIGVKDEMVTGDLKKLKQRAYLTKKVDKAKVLIIDEISMLHKNQLNLVNKVLKYLKDNEEAFGGLQVVLSGDFFQLPPIADYAEKSKDKFCFMSESWLEAEFTICYLTKQYRQTDNELHQVLDEIRKQKVSDESRQKLWNAQHTTLEGEITKLYTHNVDVDRINQEHFNKIEGIVRNFVAKQKGKAALKEILAKSVLADETLRLKKGAKVMFVKNNFEKGYVNGTLGEVFDFWKDEDGRALPLVKTGAGKTIYVGPEHWAMEDEKGGELASFEQIPLRLAWAITVHKSQGMTLDAAEIDLSQTFETGQGYVALSRISDFNGLKLLGFNTTSMQVDTLAYKADKRFLELSREAEVIFVDDELEEMRKDFILDSGGVLKPAKAKKSEKKSRKKSKLSTYEITHNLLQQGKTLKEIVAERGCTEQTVLRHFLTIKKAHPETDFSAYEPPKNHIQKVEKALLSAKEDDVELFSKNGQIKLGPIHKKLKGEVSFRDIELALLFIDY